MYVWSNAGLFAHMTKYLIDTWMYFAYVRTIRISAHVREKFHFSISIWRIYQRTKSKNTDAQNTSTYIMGIIQFAIDLGVSAHVRKKFLVSVKNLRICANNPALEDFVIQNCY